jgi:UDP-N-acetylglucosamine:LPS N-acetylglucosamine transferase
MGGYASFPAAAAAAVFGVPVVLVNVDAVPGATNRVLARVAKASAVAFPRTPLPRAVTTGAPVRAEIAEVVGVSDSNAARRALGLPPARFVVAAFGGSLGARRLNAAVIELASRWRHRSDVAMYHIVGARDAAWAHDAWDTVRSGGPQSGEDRGPDALDYRQVSYEDRMALLYQAADVAVCRAGAMTVAEICVVGLPTVLVALPGAPGDHQSANARVLAQAGAAVVVPDDECTGLRLADELDVLLSEPARLAEMGRSARALGRPDAARSVASLAEAHARARPAVLAPAEVR